MDVLQIYEKYKIPSYLQRHQFSVTAVALLVIDNFKSMLKKDDVVRACLLHDMGNIIKFDLSRGLFNESEEELKHWRGVQKEYIDKYGQDEHAATYAIASEIGVNANTLKLIESFGISNACNNVESESFEKMICCYSDQRVSPHGITSLEERLEEGRRRYGKEGGVDEFNIEKSCLEELEKQIFEQTNIKPNEITDESTKKIIEELKSFNV